MLAKAGCLGDESRQFFEIGLDHRPPFRLMQRRRRVKHRDNQHVADSFGLPMDFADRSAGEKTSHRETPQRDDDLGPDEINLAVQVRRAGRQSIRQRVAVAGGPALDHVGDVHLLAGQVDAGQ